MQHTESDRCCGTERVWLARLPKPDPSLLAKQDTPNMVASKFQSGCKISTPLQLSTPFLQTKRLTKAAKGDTYVSQVAQMSDKELMEELRKFGENPGPITDTTRGVYQRKLAKHLAEKTKGESVIE